MLCASHGSAALALDLVDDYSRADLLRYARSIGPNARAVPEKFVFPGDASARQDWAFGTDVSHHDGTIDWSKARKQEIRFAYVKASQGLEFRDNTFARHWADIGKLSGDEATRVYRGAYHFLSAAGDGAAQAQNFLAVVGAAIPSDLPATLDVEWDAPAGSDPGATDRWKSLSATEIIAKIQAWVDVVERATGKTPMIYTAASWWNGRVGNTDKLSRYRIWIADYSATSRLHETPKIPAGYVSHVWQFSEKGSAGEGFSTNIDVNVFKGSTAQLLAALGVTQ
jgi:lysozyme